MPIEDSGTDLFMSREQWIEEIQELHDYYVQLNHDRSGDLNDEERAFLSLSLERERAGVVQPYIPIDRVD